MSKESDEKQVREFLSYIANPIRHVQSNLEDGERINGLYMARVSEALAPFSSQADAALEAFDRLHPICDHNFVTCGTRAVECTKCERVFKTL